MKATHYLLPLVVAGLAVASAEAAPKKPLGKWTCEDFIALDDEYRPKAVYWASAYAKGGAPEAGELDVEGTEKLTPWLVEECQKDPKASFWVKLKDGWHKVESDTKSEMEKMKDKM